MELHHVPRALGKLDDAVRSPLSRRGRVLLHPYFVQCRSVKQVLAPPRDARLLAKARRKAAPDTAGRCGVLGAGPSLFVLVAL